jgi:hypothetical protein
VLDVWARKLLTPAYGNMEYIQLQLYCIPLTW